MAALIVLAFLFGGGFTFIIVRLSVSCLFWSSKKPNDKAYMLKTYFPYYMIALFGLGLTALIAFNFEVFLLYYVIATYFLALLIWNFKLNHSKRKYITSKEIIESQNPNLS